MANNFVNFLFFGREVLCSFGRNIFEYMAIISLEIFEKSMASSSLLGKVNLLINKGKVFAIVKKSLGCFYFSINLDPKLNFLNEASFDGKFFAYTSFEFSEGVLRRCSLDLLDKREREKENKEKKAKHSKSHSNFHLRVCPILARKIKFEGRSFFSE